MQRTSYRWLITCISGLILTAGCSGSDATGAGGARGDGAGGGSGTYPGQSNWTTTGIWETWIGRRGDVARALFYLDVRYAGGTHGVTGAAEPDLILTDDASLVATSGTNASVAHMGRLSVLLAWHAEDPVEPEPFREPLSEDRERRFAYET